ncbi:MAG: serine O-acetyltransferase [Caulobacteraceae bacterium]
MGRTLKVVSDNSSPVWTALRQEAEIAARNEPALTSMLNALILSHDSLTEALPFRLASKLGGEALPSIALREICAEAYEAVPELTDIALADMRAVLERDPACRGYLQPFLFYKGFLALQSHRIAHWLWGQGRETMAFHLQSRVSELFQVDIHPAARIGRGVFVDHATGITIGETAVVGDDVSMLHSVTLGGTGAERGDRHPKIGKGVLLGAGAKVLGNIQIGEYAKIASGSVVLKPVPAHCTAAGVPARLINCRACDEPARTMDHTLADIVYDFVI